MCSCHWSTHHTNTLVTNSFPFIQEKKLSRIYRLDEMTFMMPHSESLRKGKFEFSISEVEDRACLQSVSPRCNKIKITILMKYWCHCIDIFGQFRVKNEHVICIEKYLYTSWSDRCAYALQKCASEWQGPWNVVYVLSFQYQGHDLVGSSPVNTINSIFANIYNPILKRIVSLFYETSTRSPYLIPTTVCSCYQKLKGTWLKQSSPS